MIYRVLEFFISLFPYKVLHALGRVAGRVAFTLHRSFRKKALSNLHLAYGETKTEKERKQIAIESFQTLTITCLDYFRLRKSKHNISEIVTLEENEEVSLLMKKGQGVIFLSGHQANWEIPFLATTDKYHGIAIGRPIKNRALYNFVLSIREMKGGKIVNPKQAFKEGIRALRKGQFLGIVGDQAFPESSYSYPLFGTRAWTTTAPALFAYKTNSPIVVGTTRREGPHYFVKGSAPIWPDLSRPVKEEIPRIMDQAISLLEESIKERPGQWMWVHDRWKQQTADKVKRKYRAGSILVILPPDLKPLLPIIPLIRKIYPRSFLTFFVAKGTPPPLPEVTIREYERVEEMFVRDYRYRLVLDFFDIPKLRHHFMKLGAFQALSFPVNNSIEELVEAIQTTLVKPKCLKAATL
ncbi:MAG: Lipid A biosynthesis lauroyltransferase [Chlamydiae bacterium]|nr:Lipid A biosynthesis lauroyltransferase [Chlamydiota bacterium]